MGKATLNNKPLNKHTMSEEKIDLKPGDVSPETPPVPDQSPVQDPPLDVEALKVKAAEAEKWKNTAENYKKENEGYRIAEKQKRTESLSPKSEDPDISGDQDFNLKLLEKDKQEVLDTVVQDFANNATDEQWNRFKSVFPGVNSLSNEVLTSGRPVSRARIEQQIRSFIDYAKGTEDKSAVEKARAEGAAQAAIAAAADIGTMGGSDKPTSKTVTDEAKLVEQETGGAVSAERYLEIQENKKKRETENW